MIPYTFVVTCFNSENTLNRCLDSILNQCFSDFKVIVLDDGSTDSSASIIDEYVTKDKRLSYYHQTNQGVAVTRNNAIQLVDTNYFIFIDSDDYLDKKFLESINYSVGDADLLKYNLKLVDEKEQLLSQTQCHSFELNGVDALVSLIDSKSLFTGTCMYVYKTSFIKQYDFKFEVGRKHEDYGLIPWMIINAKTVTSIEAAHYYYVQTSNSITRGNTDDKRYHMALDMLYLSNLLLKQMDEIELTLVTKKHIQSFIALSTLLYLRNLKGKEAKLFIKQLKEANYVDYMLTNTLTRKLKKVAYKMNMGLFVRYL